MAYGLGFKGSQPRRITGLGALPAYGEAFMVSSESGQRFA